MPADGRWGFNLAFKGLRKYAIALFTTGTGQKRIANRVYF